MFKLWIVRTVIKVQLRNVPYGLNQNHLILCSFIKHLKWIPKERIWFYIPIQIWLEAYVPYIFHKEHRIHNLKWNALYLISTYGNGFSTIYYIEGWEVGDQFSVAFKRYIYSRCLVSCSISLCICTLIYTVLSGLYQLYRVCNIISREILN